MGGERDQAPLKATKGEGEGEGFGPHPPNQVRVLQGGACGWGSEGTKMSVPTDEPLDILSCLGENMNGITRKEVVSVLAVS